jgi:hypothetical protein
LIISAANAQKMRLTCGFYYFRAPVRQLSVARRSEKRELHTIIKEFGIPIKIAGMPNMLPKQSDGVKKMGAAVNLLNPARPGTLHPGRWSGLRNRNAGRELCCWHGSSWGREAQGTTVDVRDVEVLQYCGPEGPPSP